MAERALFHVFGSGRGNRRTNEGHAFVKWLPQNGSPRESWTYGL